MPWLATNRAAATSGSSIRLAEGEALRNDDDFTYVAAWAFAGEGEEPVLHKEELDFENVPLAQRSYK